MCYLKKRASNACTFTARVIEFFKVANVVVGAFFKNCMVSAIRCVVII